MPNYQAEAIYSPSNEFLDANIQHYRQLFLAHPKLIQSIQEAGIRNLIDLAGGTGLFPRMICQHVPSIEEIKIIEVGGYANDSELHDRINHRLGTQTPVSFEPRDVLEYLGDTSTACPDNTLISCVHFIDHLRQPMKFLAMLKSFSNASNVYALVYCHALDSYKGRDWFVTNTTPPGEHQIIYSRKALRNLLSAYGEVLQSEIYCDDQYHFLKINT